MICSGRRALTPEIFRIRHCSLRLAATRGARRCRWVWRGTGAAAHAAERSVAAAALTAALSCDAVAAPARPPRSDATTHAAKRSVSLGMAVARHQLPADEERGGTDARHVDELELHVEVGDGGGGDAVIGSDRRGR